MDEEFRLDKQLCFRLYTASRLITQAYHPLLSEHGLTYPQYLVLLVLWERDSQPVNDIAKRLMLETNTVTPLLKRMEAEGIVSRSRGLKDARQIIVELTPKGRSLKKKLSDVPRTIAGGVLCGSVTEDTIPGLFGMLDGIINSLKEPVLVDKQ